MLCVAIENACILAMCKTIRREFSFALCAEITCLDTLAYELMDRLLLCMDKDASTSSAE